MGRTVSACTHYQYIRPYESLGQKVAGLETPTAAESRDGGRVDRAAENATMGVLLAQYRGAWSPKALKRTAFGFQILSPMSIWRAERLSLAAIFVS